MTFTGSLTFFTKVLTNVTKGKQAIKIGVSITGGEISEKSQLEVTMAVK